jgi:hypothetical protein
VQGTFQLLLWVLEQLVLLEIFDELRGGLDFSCCDTYTKEKRFVRVDVDCATVESELSLGLVSCTGYFTGLGVAAVQRAAAVSRMRCASTSWSSAETAPLLPSSAGLSVNSLAHNPEENSSGSMDRQPQEPIEHRD